MVILIAVCLIYFLIFYSFGKIFFKNYTELVSISVVLGMLSVSVIALIVAFFIPLHLYFEIFLLAIAMLFWLVKGKSFILQLQSKYRINITFVILSLLIICITAFAPFIADHFGYYVPTITSLNTFGLQQGLVNIHLVLGQQSVWHLLQASFDNSFDFYLRINGFLLLIFLLYIFERQQFALLVFIPILLLFSQSPSPDLPVYIFSLIIINEVTFEKSHSISMCFLLSIFVFCIKPTAFFLPFFIILFVFITQNFRKLFSLRLIISFVLIALFFIKNYWVCSNVFFPISFTYIDTIWKPLPEIIQQSQHVALQKTYDFQFSYAQILQFSWSQKILFWFQLAGFKRVIHFIILLTLLVFLIFSTFKKNKIYIILASIVIAKTFIVIVVSGQYRFMLDGILVLIFVLINEIIASKKIYYFTSISGIFMVLVAFIFPVLIQTNISSFKVGNLIQAPKMEQIYKPQSYALNDFSVHKIGNLTFYITNYYLLLNTPMPSFTKTTLQDYLQFGYFPQYKNNNSKILIMRKLNPSEKENLSLIIQKFQ